MGGAAGSSEQSGECPDVEPVQDCCTLWTQVHLSSPDGHEQRHKPVRDGYYVGAGVPGQVHGSRPGGDWDTDGEKVDGLASLEGI